MHGSSTDFATTMACDYPGLERSGIARAIEEGAKCRGYHYWGAIDCWSWNNAFKNRYGFVEVDLAHQYRRVPKESSDWIREVARTHIVR